MTIRVISGDACLGFSCPISPFVDPDTGPQGDAGPQGPSGTPGPPGPATYLSILDYGASTASVDNSAAIQAAIDAAATLVDAGVLVPQGSYRFISALTNAAAIPIVMLGEIVFAGSGVAALTIGGNVGNIDAPSAWPSILKVVREAQDWSDASPGVAIVNVDEWHGTVNIQDFEVGLLLEGIDTGCAYNQISVQRIFGCRVGIRLRATGTGWSNENIVIGGRFGTLQATSSAQNIHAVEFVCDSGVSRPNGNKFYGPSIELFNTGAGYTSAIHGSFSVGTLAAQNNVMENARIEQTDYWLSGRGLIENVVSINFLGPNEVLPTDILNADTPEDQLVLIQNLIDTNRVIFGSADPIRVAGFDRSNVVAIGANVWRPARGVVWNRATNSVANATAGTLDADSLTISSTSGVGIILDLRGLTRDYQRMLTLKAQIRATGGRFFCVCWDAAFTLLSSADACSLAFNAGVGYYRNGSDLSADFAEQVVTFGDSVAFVLVGVAAGTAAVDLSGFDVFGLGVADIRPVIGSELIDALSSVAPGNVAQIDIGDPIANAVPSVPGVLTTYPVGTFVRNILGASGITEGWVYTGSSWVVVPTTLDINADADIGPASSFATFTGSPFAATVARQAQVSSTVSLSAAAYKLFVQEGSRNPRCMFFLQDAASGSGGWGHWYSFGSAGLQPYMVGFGTESAQLRLASGSSSSSYTRGGAATGSGTGGTYIAEGGPGGPTSGAGGAFTGQGGLPTDGNGGDANLYGRDAATTTAANRNGGNNGLRGGLATGTGRAGRTRVERAFALVGIISPPALAANEDNWNPAGLDTCNTIRATSAGGGSTLTGITAGTDGQVISLWKHLGSRQSHACARCDEHCCESLPLPEQRERRDPTEWRHRHPIRQRECALAREGRVILG